MDVDWSLQKFHQTVQLAKSLYDISAVQKSITFSLHADLLSGSRISAAWTAAMERSGVLSSL
jgi:hypothetical protein